MSLRVTTEAKNDESLGKNRSTGIPNISASFVDNLIFQMERFGFNVRIIFIITKYLKVFTYSLTLRY